MEVFVQNEFAPMLKDSNNGVNSMPKYMSSVQPLIQMSAFLYHIKKDRHVHIIHKMHSLFCDKLDDKQFITGVHKFIVSILAALMTQADQVIKMFPVLTGLGKRITVISTRNYSIMIGTITQKLANIFNWDEQIVQAMQNEIKARNGKINDRGLIRSFFEFPEKFRPSNFQTSNQAMAIKNGRYYKLIVVPTTKVLLKEEIWKGQVSQKEIQLSQEIFNANDSDLAVIISELGDLHLTSNGMMDDSERDLDHVSNPVSHFSELECFKRAEQNIEDDPELRLKLEQMEKSLQSSNKWTEEQLTTQFRLPNVALFRLDSGACVGYDWKLQKFCEDPVAQNSSWCLKHAQEGNDLKMIREMGTLATKKGVLLVKGITRVKLGPEKLDKVVEYAPSLEGAAPAFRHSTENLEKLLEAGFETYKVGFSEENRYFDDKEFRSRFPNAKFISNDRWKHAYLALKETMQAYAFDLKANWTRNVPFLLGKLGAYQGWINSEEIVDQKKFVSASYEYKSLGTVADIMKDTSNRAKPVAPALLFDPAKMDGTSTPSTQSTDNDGMCYKMNQKGLPFAKVSWNDLGLEILI